MNAVPKLIRCTHCLKLGELAGCFPRSNRLYCLDCAKKYKFSSFVQRQPEHKPTLTVVPKEKYNPAFSTRKKLLEFLPLDRELTLAEIAKLVPNTTYSCLRKALKKLEAQSFMSIRKAGNCSYFKLLLRD